MLDHSENPLHDVHTGAVEQPQLSRTEEEEIERIIEREIEEWNAEEHDDPQPDNRPLRWPTQDLDNPINEYTTDGYIAMAFPTLFPTGCADLRDQSDRQMKIKIAEYFDALLRYKDGRFGSHPRYALILSYD